MTGSSPISDIYFFTISAMDLSEIAVFRNDIDLVKPRNTGPDVMPLAVNHFFKARTASNEEPCRLGIATMAP